MTSRRSLPLAVALVACVHGSSAPTIVLAPPPPVVAEPVAPTPRYPAPVEEYLRALRLDPSRPDAWYNIGMYCVRYDGGERADLRRAIDYLQRFVSLAGRDERLRVQVERANRELRSSGGPIPYLVASSADAGPPVEPPPPSDCAPDLGELSPE